MAAARMGLRTALYTINLDLIAQMSCNPAVGGIAKGHLVREMDALGGVMGEVIDAVGIQFRLLNTSRGPAVWSPRAQGDKKQYRLKMRQVLESEPNLRIKQAEVVDLVVEDAPVRQYVSETDSGATDNGQPTTGRSVAVCVLRDGRTVEARRRDHHHRHLSQRPDPLRRETVSRRTLRRAALGAAGRSAASAWACVGRLKTGTPPRLDAPHHRLSKFKVQPGDADPTPFSFRTRRVTHPQAGLLDHLHQRRRRTASSARTCTARRCIPGRSRASGRAIVPRSKTRSSSSPTRSSTRFSSSPRAWTPTRSTSTACPPRCPSTCSWPW